MFRCVGKIVYSEKLKWKGNFGMDPAGIIAYQRSATRTWSRTRMCVRVPGALRDRGWSSCWWELGWYDDEGLWAHHRRDHCVGDRHPAAGVISGDCHPETPAVRTFLEMDVVRFQAMIWMDWNLSRSSRVYIETMEYCKIFFLRLRSFHQ
jgi:hypothetical protein